MLFDEFKKILVAKNFGKLFSSGGGVAFPSSVVVLNGGSYTVPNGYIARFNITTTAYTSGGGSASFVFNGFTVYHYAYMTSPGNYNTSLNFTSHVKGVILKSGSVISGSYRAVVELYLE